MCELWGFVFWPLSQRRRAVLLKEPFSPVTSPSVMGRSGVVYEVANNLRALD